MYVSQNGFEIQVLLFKDLLWKAGATAQPVFTCSNSTMGTPEQCLKFIQSLQ